MAKIILFPKNSEFHRKYIWIITIFFISILSLYKLQLLTMKYKQQLFEFNRLKQVYETQSTDQREIGYVLKNESLNIEIFDRIMFAKPEHLLFDHMKLSKNGLLEIQGVTSQPLEIERFIQQAELEEVKLQINQVQTDSEKRVHFELRQSP